MVVFQRCESTFSIRRTRLSGAALYRYLLPVTLRGDHDTVDGGAYRDGQAGRSSSDRAVLCPP